MLLKLAESLLLLSVAAAALASTTPSGSSDGMAALRAENARLRHEDAAKTDKIARLSQANSDLRKEVAAQDEKIAGLNQENSVLRKLAEQAKKAELKESATPSSISRRLQRRSPTTAAACVTKTATAMKQAAWTKCGPVLGDELGGSFDWSQCVSEGGTKECARCAGSGNGTLPCYQVVPHSMAKENKYASCPDDEIFKNRKVFVQRGSTGKGHCHPLIDNSTKAFRSVGATTWKFPQVKGSLVFTKLRVMHPHKASTRVGAVLFKRLVTHKAGSTEKADVMKMGLCVKCKRSIYSSNGGSKATAAEHTNFVDGCLKNALDAQGKLKSGYDCTGEDAKVFGAALKGF